MITLLVPGVILAAMTHFAEEMSDSEALQVAAVAVKNYVDGNPPREGWRATKIYIEREQSGGRRRAGAAV